MPPEADRLSSALADRYRIERRLGEGGMATVYLAEDVKHHRKVAVKVLRPELAAVLGAERFVQEIETTASLQHPHILPLFDSGEADSFLYYVMPYIDGETLRDKLNRETQLGVDEAVRITIEIADALDYAHRHDVVHRDIKPENILLHDGRPMVADFGIALAVSAAAGGRMTETGLSLGTPHYMSPEQATAEKELTNRSDIYSLGSVLYEMLTGNPPHSGASAQQIIMKIVTEDAQPVTRHRRSVPPNVEAAVARSLEKLPADRFESAQAFIEALQNPAFRTIGITDSGDAGVMTVTAGVPRPIFAATAVAAALALGLAAWAWLRPQPLARVSRFPIVLRQTQFQGVMSSNRSVFEGPPAIAPDGSSIVFVDSVGDGVELRRKWRDESGSEPIPGTGGGHTPIFSPDGAWIAYFTEDGRVRKMPAAEGGSVDLVNDANGTYLSGAWMDDGTIVYFDAASSVSQVSSNGGESRVVVPGSATREQIVASMSPLPASRGVLVSLCPGHCLSNPTIGVVDLNTDSLRILVDNAVGGWYAPTGHLLYTPVTGGLYAVEFDLDRLQLIGGPVSVIEGVSPGEFAVARSGTALYSTGRSAARSAELVWVSRDGSVEPVDSEWRGDFYYPALSPDGQSIAVSVAEETTQLWVRRPEGSRQRLTLDGTINWRPTWSADGSTIGFVGIPVGGGSGGNDWDAFDVPADGSGAPRLLLHQEEGTWEVDYSRDGRWLLDRTDNSAGTYSHIHARGLDGDTMRVDIAVGRGFNRQPALSPDSRWLAYTATESGRLEVYLASFPDMTTKRLVSQGGGQEPRWGASGRELFFKSAGALMVVDVPPGPNLLPSLPRRLFQLTGFRAAINRHQYDVTPDGQRFLMIRDRGRDGDLELVYVENWFEELRARTRVN